MQDIADVLHGRIRNTLKVSAWERAKGALREMVAIDGSATEHMTDADGKFPYEHTQERVESFIKQFEEDGFNE